MKTKTAEAILEEIFNPSPQDCTTPKEDLQLAITLNPDLNKILSAMEEYKNQFSQLPASVTDEEIEKMAFIEIPYSDTEGKNFTYNKFYKRGLTDMRSLLNHPPVMGEGEKLKLKNEQVDFMEWCALKRASKPQWFDDNSMNKNVAAYIEYLNETI